MTNKIFINPAITTQGHRIKSEENIKDKAMPVIDEIYTRISRRKTLVPAFNLISLHFLTTTIQLRNQLISISDNPTRSSKEGPCFSFNTITEFPWSGSNKMIRLAQNKKSSIHFLLVITLTNKIQ